MYCISDEHMLYYPYIPDPRREGDSIFYGRQAPEKNRIIPKVSGKFEDTSGEEFYAFFSCLEKASQFRLDRGCSIVLKVWVAQLKEEFLPIYCFSMPYVFLES
jgi:hypothetical protein